MSKFRSYLGLFGCYMKVNMAASLEYRSSFAVQAFGMAISNASFVFFWWIAFQQMGGAIGGYSFNDVLFIWSVCPTAFGIAYVVFGNASQITRLIIQGELDTYLLQPKDALLSLLFARSRLTAWGDLFYGIILLAVSQSGNPKVWLPFALGSVLGAILCTAIVVTAHSCTFFLGDASLLGSMALEFVINFSIYPIGIYPALVRFLMYSLIPAAFITHIPLQMVHTSVASLLFLELAATILYSWFAYWFFHRGLRRYESGNLIVLRE